MESKIDDIKEAVYALRPVVARLDENVRSVELRLGFIEKNNARVDERLSALEKRSDRKRPPSLFNLRSALEMFAALPVVAHVVPAALMFLAALWGFVHEYAKLHH